jgi:hypothetical protein
VLTLQVPLDPVEMFNETTETFVTTATKFFTLELEHSLVSLSKWEAFFKKPFLSEAEKTSEETLWYIKAMVLTPDVPPEVFDTLSQSNVDQIEAYIEDSMTATWFSKTNDAPSREVVTSELIYYWLVAMSIPFEVENWHLNRMLTLVKVCNKMTQPPKKMTQAELHARNRELNEQRRKELGTKG